MTQDRPSLGIMLMLCFCVLAPFADALSKILGQSLAVMVIVYARFVAQVVLLGPLALRRPTGIERRHLRPITQRAILHIFGIAMMFTSLLYLPLADAIAIAFVMPFLMLLLGWWVLGEEVGPFRLIACAVGFCGTLLVVQPSFAQVGWPAMLPLGVAIVFALFMLQTRTLAKDINAVALQAASGSIAMVILTPLIVFAALVPLPWLPVRLPTGLEWQLLALTGVVGAVAHLFMTSSLRYAPSATLAPMQYIEIPFATLFGYLIFHDFPNGPALVGICITIGAGLFIIWREQAAQSPKVGPQEAG